MEIVLTIINLICFGGAWYFLSRGSIYAKLIKGYREALEVIGAQETMIQAYKMKYNTEKRRKKMENKINIAEILRDMPKGTKLYSPLFGKCEYIGVVNSEYPIVIKTQGTDDAIYKGFMKDGRYFDGYEDAECLLYPSAKMRCWDKFFKRGDVLVDCDLETTVVFDGWANDDYTEFNTAINHYKISDTWGKGDICSTLLYTKATDEERAKFIAAAEKHYGGKYNPETLQVEPIKVIEPKCLLKPFDKVLVRDSDAGIWKAARFLHYIGEYEYPYFTTSSAYKQCVPYDCNEYLLGTNKSPE